jgi:hypothetical protein
MRCLVVARLTFVFRYTISHSTPEVIPQLLCTSGSSFRSITLDKSVRPVDVIVPIPLPLPAILILVIGEQTSYIF